MNHILLSAVVLSLFACGPSEELAEGETETGSTQQELISDAWQGIYALRRSGPSTFVYNPIGDMTITCLDGSIAQECSVGRLNFGPSGLNAVRQQETLSRVDNEPAGEGSIAVLVKAQPTHVRDHRTNTTYDELRILAVYRAPSVRPHATRFAYVASAVKPDGFQTTHGLNSDFMSRTIDVASGVKYFWVGPASQAPNFFPVDNIFTVSAFRPVGTGTLGAFYEFDVDQRFKRITN